MYALALRGEQNDTSGQMQLSAPMNIEVYRILRLDVGLGKAFTTFYESLNITAYFARFGQDGELARQIPFGCSGPFSSCCAG